MISSARSSLLSILIFLSAPGLTGCAFFLSLDPAPHVPMPSNSNAAIIGIAVKVKHIWGNDTCAQGIFIKLEEAGPDDVMRGRILSNTRYGQGYTYLLNVQPGRYAAVGCIVRGRYGYSVFFNKPLIARLTQTINPGTVVLLGNITVDVNGIRNESQLDEVQQHYFRELFGKDVHQALEDHRFLGFQFPTQGATVGDASLDYEYSRNSASRQFLTMLSQYLPTAWDPWIRNSVASGT